MRCQISCFPPPMAGGNKCIWPYPEMQAARCAVPVLRLDISLVTQKFRHEDRTAGRTS